MILTETNGRNYGKKLQEYLDTYLNQNIDELIEIDCPDDECDAIIKIMHREMLGKDMVSKVCEKCNSNIDIDLENMAKDIKTQLDKLGVVLE